MNQRILAYETSELDLTTLLPDILYIILVTPTFVNGLPSTFTLWPIIEYGFRTILPVTRSHLPYGFGVDFDFVVVASGTHIVVVLERIHAIYHCRADKKPCRY